MLESRIETLSPGDYDALVDLWRDAGLPSRPKGRDRKDAILAQMALPNCRFLGARDPGGKLLGAAIANHEGRKGWINRIAVRPSLQRSGIARALVAACEEWLFGTGIQVVAALVEGDNPTSQSFFSACGYERDDTLVYFRKANDPSA